MHTPSAKTGSDGSFKVRLRFDAAPKSELASIQQWLSDWVQRNGQWALLGETYRFSDCFSEVPRVRIDETGAPYVTLQVFSTHRGLWSDWYVWLCQDIVRAFPEVGGVSGVEDNSE